MKDADFRQLLESCTTLSRQQRDILCSVLECMTTSMTLRPAARTCNISLDTSFHLRHRIMALLQSEQAELLQGIVKLDETFFVSHTKDPGIFPLNAQHVKEKELKKVIKAGPTSQVRATCEDLCACVSTETQ